MQSPIHIMMPKLSPVCQKSIDQLIDRFSKKHKDIKIELNQKTQGLSALKSLMTANLSDNLPDLSVVEIGEVPLVKNILALPPLDSKKMQLLLKGMKPYLIHQSRDHNTQFHSLPWFRIAPVLVINQELLFRNHLQTDQFPQKWNRLIKLLKTVKSKIKSKSPTLAWSLLGSQGLWIVEAWMGIPLWKSNGEAHPIVYNKLRELQAWIYQSGITQPGQDRKTAMDSFLQQKSPFLITSSSELPNISQAANFRWTSTPMPLQNTQSALVGSGNQILIHQPSIEVWKFLNFIYSSTNAVKWVQSCGCFPLKKSWSRKGAVSPQSAKYWKTLKKIGTPGTRPILSDLLKTRSVWTKALDKIFGAPDQPKDIAKTLQLMSESL